MKRAILTLPLKGEYFDQIKSGEKLYEYRMITPFWAIRLKGKVFASVVLTRGYPKGGGIEGATRLTREWRGFALRTLTHPHFGPDPVNVFAIDVSTPATLTDTPQPIARSRENERGRNQPHPRNLPRAGRLCNW